MINKIVEHRKQVDPYYNDEVLLEQLDERNLINRKMSLKQMLKLMELKIRFEWSRIISRS